MERGALLRAPLSKRSRNAIDMKTRRPSRSSALMAALALAVVASGALATGMQGTDRASRMRWPGSADASGAGAAAFADDAKLREQDIAFYRDRALADTLSAADRAQLAALYLQRARETGDIADYGRAEAAARRSLALRSGRNGKAAVVLASSLLALHRFPEALTAARGFCDELPDRPAACALLAEIQLEMGDYDAAAASFAALAPFRGDLAVAPRLARWYEITGRTDDAWRLLLDVRAEAVRRDALPREQVAWFHLRVGDIALRNGDLDRAERALGEGLRVEPADARLLAAMARSRALRHDWRAALDYALRTGDRADLATLALIGDAYAALGDPMQAERWYDAVERAAAGNPEPFNRQWMQFRLDHGRALGPTLELLRAEIAIRRDVYGWDQLAWALHRTGDHAAARVAMAQALRMGTRDAVLFFHAGSIERALGNDAAAKRWLRAALETNPRFHPVFPAQAKAVLDTLRTINPAPEAQ
jgi:tetratricopeptide (TPR) repeat protein